jgi:hypothetical protein
MDLLVGQRLTVLDALGRVWEKRVLSSGNGPAFLACEEDEWAAAQRTGREPKPELFAWHVEDVVEHG